MSNGDDVLDNWEEIDEAAVAPSTEALKRDSAPFERILQTEEQNIELLKNLPATDCSRPMQMKLLQRNSTQDAATTTVKSPLDDMAATFQPVMMVLHKPQDEYQSANYTAPIVNQTVKILRRPTQSTEIRNNGIRPKQPIKTLQQREQEYAEARLRILGSAKNPEDEDLRTQTSTNTSILTNTTNQSSTTTTATSVVTLSNNSVANVVTSAVKNNSPKLPNAQYSNHFNQQQSQKFPPNYQQQQNYFYNQQQPQSPAYNNNRTYNMNPLLALGPMGSLGQPAQYQNNVLPSPQTQQQQQHFKYQQYHQKSSQQQHKTPQQPQQTWSPVVGGSVSSSSIRQQPNDTILRMPRGPDGSTGFQTRR